MSHRGGGVARSIKANFRTGETILQETTVAETTSHIWKNKIRECPLLSVKLCVNSVANDSLAQILINVNWYQCP